MACHRSACGFYSGDRYHYCRNTCHTCPSGKFNAKAYNLDQHCQTKTKECPAMQFLLETDNTQDNVCTNCPSGQHKSGTNAIATCHVPAGIETIGYQVLYKEGTKGSNSCPDGHAPITSKSDCEAAAFALGLPLTTATRINSDYKPKGCHHLPGICPPWPHTGGCSGLQFNTHPIGSGNFSSYKATICRGTVPTSCRLQRRPRPAHSAASHACACGLPPHTHARAGL